MQNQHHEQVPPMLEHLTHQMTHVALISAANGVDAYLMPSYDAALAFLRKRISGFLRLLPESAQQQQVEQMSVNELSHLVSDLTNTPSTWVAIASLVTPYPCRVVGRAPR